MDRRFLDTYIYIAFVLQRSPLQVNVGVGAYRCDEGMPFVLPVVREAENEINLEELDHEYSGIVSAVENTRACYFIWKTTCELC